MKSKNLTLIDLKEGEEAKIISSIGGQKATQRLSDLELTPDTKIKVITKTFFGPIEIEVRGSKLALGRGIASKILVKK